MRRFWILSLATVAGVGYCPVASGTAASLVALLPYWVLRPHPVGYAAAILVLAGVGIWVSGEAERLLGEKDPHAVVIDEVAGYLVAAAWLPPHWGYAVAAFFLFRLFDVWKPFPIRRLQDWPGGWGVVADDLLAGVYANLLLQAFHWLMRARVAG